MVRIGYAPGAFDLFHIGHLNLLRRAKEHCDFLIAGVVADEVLIQHKRITPVIPLSERIEIVRHVRFVDMAHAAMTDDKTEIWRELQFNVLFKGDDWQGTERAIASNGTSRRSASRCFIFPITRRRRAVRCAGRCKPSISWPIVV
jgi:glycerol-3-phosphate cytidylyltransferase